MHAPAGTEQTDDWAVEFKSDHRGRQIEKIHWTYNGSTWEEQSHRKFVWDGWLMVMELDGTDNNAVLRTYTWGLDLAGQSGASASGRSALDGAGGIGGLLAVHDTPTGDDYVYFYDANGNVGQLVDWAHIADWQQKGLTGPTDWHADRLVAHYEYDPYGNNLLDPTDAEESGPYAATNAIRFSTKYWDDETGLGYWGYRYYSPRLGRWLNRDPIGEQGGYSLYRLLGNNPTTAIDLLGLAATCCNDNAAPATQPANEERGVCCMYAEEYEAWGRGAKRHGHVIARIRSRCYKEETCPPGVDDPALCCTCECLRKTTNTSTKRTLVEARWGNCCYCIAEVRRMPWSTLLPHHQFVLSCPASRWGPQFSINIDRWPDNTIAGGANIRYFTGSGTLPIRIAKKEIPCDVGQALKKRIDNAHPISSSFRGFDRDWDCILLHRDCLSFANYWLWQAGPQVRECR